MRATMVLAMLLVGSCANTPAPETASTASVGTVSGTLYSWGKPVRSWSASPDGEIRFTETIPGETQSFVDFWEVTRRKMAGPEAYAEIVALVAPARKEAGKPEDCTARVFDAPYGGIKWSGPPEVVVGLDGNCLAERTGRIFGAERAASDRAYALTRDGEEVSRVHHDPEHP